MSYSQGPAVGIDLGTTYSVIAHLDDVGRPQTLRNMEGDLTTPSVVLFDGEDVIVGKEAVKAMSREAERVAECAKRDMGQAIYNKPVDGRQLPPEAIQAYVLKKLAVDAHRQIGSFQHAVITVPAYFDEVRRKATEDAGYIAGLDVLDIINEPTAAALSIGVEKGFLTTSGESRRRQTILVYDLGGGTFDVTAMTVEESEFNVLATDGDVQLGGRDWDQRLVDLVAEKFIRENGFDPREDANFQASLWRDCEDAKRTLSSRRKVRISCDFKGKGLQLEVSREQFEESTRDLLDRTEFTTREVLRAANLDWSSIDRLLLVGGSSRMPMVAEMLRKATGKDPDFSASADEAVAHGAAVHAGLILAKNRGEAPKFKVKNVNSHSLGVVAVDRKTGESQNVTLIPRNTPLPVAARKVFKTQKLGQKSVLVKIVEGESPLPENCTQLGRCVIRDLPSDLPAGTPIMVVFSYAANGRLSVHVVVAGTDRTLAHEIVRENTLPRAELDRWRTKVHGPA